ncbi:MAG: hypothetical protein WEB06_19435 [Actinomycetota bacterium]
MSKQRFTPVDAARVALAAPRVVLTSSQLRVVGVAARTWCQELQFPTVRTIASELGCMSPSTVLSGFPHLIDVQASVIALEWHRLEVGLSSPEGCDPVAWLGAHAGELLAIDRACLRLPALVWAAVASAAPSTSRSPDLKVALMLHALAAFADGLPGSPTGLDHVRSHTHSRSIEPSSMVVPA